MDKFYNYKDDGEEDMVDDDKVYSDNDDEGRDLNDYDKVYDDEDDDEDDGEYEDDKVYDAEVADGTEYEDDKVYDTEVSREEDKDDDNALDALCARFGLTGTKDINEFCLHILKQSQTEGGIKLGQAGKYIQRLNALILVAKEEDLYEARNLLHSTLGTLRNRQSLDSVIIVNNAVRLEVQEWEKMHDRNPGSISIRDVQHFKENFPYDFNHKLVNDFVDKINMYNKLTT